jgi:outer membrane protein assembly factor BamB
LATQWPEEGPRKLWKRDLGEGYSAVVADNGVLYTLYRSGEQDVVCALDGGTGETKWEFKYAAPAAEGHIMQFTAAPRSTPLLSEGQLYTVNVAGVMHCLDAATGEVRWKHDLWKEYNGSFLNHGYSTSPFAYKDTVIMLVGGEENAIMAFNKKDGSVAWKRHSFKNSYSTPKLINVDGQEQLVCFMAEEVIGIDPANGDLKWSHAHANQFGQNICMPVLHEDNILVITSPEAGAKGLKLKKNGDKTDVKEIWSTRKVQIHHGNWIRVGDYLYGSTGTGAPCFFMAIDVKDGKLAWRERGFAKATCVYGDGKFIILDEDGNLGLATATPEGFNVHTKTALLEKVAWTVPTLVGKTLIVRDMKSIMALDLGSPTG